MPLRQCADKKARVRISPFHAREALYPLLQPFRPAFQLKALSGKLHIDARLKIGVQHRLPVSGDNGAAFGGQCAAHGHPECICPHGPAHLHSRQFFRYHTGKHGLFGHSRRTFLSDDCFFKSLPRIPSHKFNLFRHFLRIQKIILRMEPGVPFRLFPVYQLPHHVALAGGITHGEQHTPGVLEAMFQREKFRIGPAFVSQTSRQGVQNLTRQPVAVIAAHGILVQSGFLHVPTRGIDRKRFYFRFGFPRPCLQLFIPAPVPVRPHPFGSGIHSGFHETGHGDSVRAFQPKRVQFPRRQIHQSVFHCAGVHFRIRRQQAVKHSAHIVGQFHIELERLSVDIEQPFSETGKGGFQRTGRGLAFPQVLLKAPREHFLFGTVPRVFLHPVGQGVKLALAVSGHGLFHGAIILSFQGCVVIQRPQPRLQGIIIHPQGFVGQPGPDILLHLEQEHMTCFMQKGGKISPLVKLNQILVAHRRDGCAGIVPDGIMKERLAVRSERLYNSFTLRSIAGLKTCSSGACSICGIVNFRLCIGGVIIQPSGYKPCFPIAEAVKRQNGSMIIMGNKDAISPCRVLSAAYFSIGQNFRHFSGNGLPV